MKTARPETFPAALRRLASRWEKRRGEVRIRSMGKTRVFSAYDLGPDTFVFERGARREMAADGRVSVLLARKSDLARGAKGKLMAISTGNHSVAAIPLLCGRFWNLSDIPRERRSRTLASSVLCANTAGGKLELSQRDIPFGLLRTLDGWLTGPLGIPPAAVMLAERTEEVLAHYAKAGQEWRVKPVAATEDAMRSAVESVRKHISTAISYYHSAKGTHFLAYPEFHEFALRAAKDWDAFRSQLKELAGVFEGQRESFSRLLKPCGLHEIEYFGIAQETAGRRIVPALELLLEGIALGRISRKAAARRIAEIDSLYKSELADPALADASSPEFAAALYSRVFG